MTTVPVPWDYLILTASNRAQARAYEGQLGVRRRLGHLAQARNALVVSDLEDRRIGSGGSTIQCLLAILTREMERCGGIAGYGLAGDILRRLRILIVHAGGDSKRLPAYGPCGKIFVPVPGDGGSPLGATLFDRLVPQFLELPPARDGEGQVVVASGDALIRFDAGDLVFRETGMTAVGCYASPEESARHGVFCLEGDGSVRLYLQKPSPGEQAEAGAINRHGQSVLDAGIMSLDAGAALILLKVFGVTAEAGGFRWTGRMRQAILEHGLDLYREICCAMGTQTTADRYLRNARASGSRWEAGLLEEIYAALWDVPLHVQVLPRFSFLHFGSTRQLVSSGLVLARQDQGVALPSTCLEIDNQKKPEGNVQGSDAWVEGCRIGAPLRLAGHNVVTGVDVDEPLSLAEGACLDVLSGSTRSGDGCWFVRCYGVRDAFKDTVSGGARFCGIPVAEWLSQAGLEPEDVWSAAIPAGERTLWDARVFPAEDGPFGYRRWLWLFAPAAATPEQKQAYRSADRYSAAEIALLADQEQFHERRAIIRAVNMRGTLRRLFRPESAYSAEDLAHTLAHAPDRGAWAGELLAEARWHSLDRCAGGGLASFISCRIMHSLGTAITQMAAEEEAPVSAVLPRFEEGLDQDTAAWLGAVGLLPDPAETAASWGGRLCAAAFRKLNASILESSLRPVARPRNALRADETAWGRAPARIELGGGWTDTPPYTLEYGGDVINAAVNLNGQPPIHCYCRVIDEPVIRLGSIDGGKRLEITALDELLDYSRPGDSFALAKAALAISGFSPRVADWPEGITLPGMLAEFGGGIELTTLVGIPKGSGLGTSSILGAVILAVIQRVLGIPEDRRALFHDVLRLEQALTTGGGWQDQIGGGIGGTKITTTARGLFPDPCTRYVPDDVLDPRLNGGSTLLYYTGLTRLAKNILQQIVGRYFDRNRAVMAALAEEHRVAHALADAMSRKDAADFGRYVDAAWELQKRLCGDVSNPDIEGLLAKVRPHVHGMRISGAGSGGFLLMIAKSPGHAAEIRSMLERNPLNERARFFDFEINHKGLEVTTC